MDWILFPTATNENGDGFEFPPFEHLVQKALEELGEAGYPSTIQEFKADGYGGEFAPDGRIRDLFEVVQLAEWIKDALGGGQFAMAVNFAFELGVKAARCGLPEVEIGRRTIEWRKAGAAAANGDRVDDWTAWQQTLDELYRDSPALSYRQMLLQAAQKHGVSERIIKKRCRNPKK